jgi:hypothetical protein
VLWHKVSEQITDSDFCAENGLKFLEFIAGRWKDRKIFILVDRMEEFFDQENEQRTFKDLFSHRTNILLASFSASMPAQLPSHLFGSVDDVQQVRSASTAGSFRGSHDSGEASQIQSRTPAR